MRVALVHELLTMRGGAERLLRIFAEMFPDAPIYTFLYNEKKLGDWFPKERIRTSSLQKVARLLNCPLSIIHSSGFNHHLYLPWFPHAVEQWSFETKKFDLVISTSSAFVHGIITNSAPKHLCYVNSPARYLWDRTHDVLERTGKGPFGLFRKFALSSIFHRLRIWDSEAAERPDKLLASSCAVQRRIELYWRRKSDVVSPPIDDFWFQDSLSPRERVRVRGYYFIASTLAPYKRIDLAIEACNALKVPLKIAGEGPDRKRLEKLAGPTIEFLGFKNNEELRALYHNAQATIFPGEEDFGLVPLESIACGTPVIAYRGGGARETMIEKKTGVFFDSPTSSSLRGVVETFDNASYDPEHCRSHASLFSRKTFEEAIHQHIQEVLSST